MDKTNSANNSCYDIIIGNNLLCKMGVDIWFKDENIKWYRDKILLEINGSLKDPNIYDML